ncbi:hypothetical protein FPV67DRAFT_567869 [Lyophyllum atratum]|nr:hypothetical protein FPV67DRAFT_567869 [Lyophyllum atratum]
MDTCSISTWIGSCEARLTIQDFHSYAKLEVIVSWTSGLTCAPQSRELEVMRYVRGGIHTKLLATLLFKLFIKSVTNRIPKPHSCTDFRRVYHLDFRFGAEDQGVWVGSAEMEHPEVVTLRDPHALLNDHLTSEHLHHPHIAAHRANVPGIRPDVDHRPTINGGEIPTRQFADEIFINVGHRRHGLPLNHRLGSLVRTEHETKDARKFPPPIEYFPQLLIDIRKEKAAMSLGISMRQLRIARK